MTTNLQTDPQHASDLAREAAYTVGYDDYISGYMTHAPQYRDSPLAAEYERGAAAAVFDVVDKRVKQPHLVLVPNPVGRKYQAKHRAGVTA